MKISLQTSRDQRGRTRETSARYATAWLNHGTNPSDANYEYTIVVNKPANVVQVKCDYRAVFICFTVTVTQTTQQAFLLSQIRTK